jgi:uncharacterized damage-inducible protein DinB
MPEVERIVELLQVCYNGGPWHGPSLMGNLDGVTAEQAAQKPIPNGHCIWELVQHMTGWINETIQVLDGEQYATLPAEQDWPAIGSDDAAWQAALGILDSSQEALCGAVGEMQEDKLWELPEGQEFNYYWLLHGVVLHYAYHTGQIGLLRKSFS